MTDIEKDIDMYIHIQTYSDEAGGEDGGWDGTGGADAPAGRVQVAAKWARYNNKDLILCPQFSFQVLRRIK